MNYNREFLVPYLENICALEILRIELNKEINKLKDTIHLYNKGEYDEKIHSPGYYESEFTFGRIALIVWGVLCILACLALPINVDIDADNGGMFIFVLFIGGGMGVGCLWWGVTSILESRNNNKRLDEEYNIEKDRAERAKKINSINRDLIPSLNSSLEFFNGEYTKVNNLLIQAYDVNVIPNQYRNLYASVYLYDYFKTSQATDLERALTLFVLEEIKERLDFIIQQQSEMILHQQVIIAEQIKTREQQEIRTRMMISKLDSIIASNEERNKYLDMIEVNTHTTAFFATVEYLK